MYSGVVFVCILTAAICGTLVVLGVKLPRWAEYLMIVTFTAAVVSWIFSFAPK